MFEFAISWNELLALQHLSSKPPHDFNLVLRRKGVVVVDGGMNVAVTQVHMDCLQLLGSGYITVARGYGRIAEPVGREWGETQGLEGILDDAPEAIVGFAMLTRKTTAADPDGEKYLNIRFREARVRWPKEGDLRQFIGPRGQALFEERIYGHDVRDKGLSELRSDLRSVLVYASTLQFYTLDLQ